jgi:hypothetical protein
MIWCRGGSEMRLFAARVVVLLGLLVMADPSCLSASDVPLSEKLLSTDTEERALALATAQQQSRLSQDELKALVASLRLPCIPEGISDTRWVYGPVTAENAVTRLLLRQADASFPFLLAGLESDNSDVRRYASFCLGRMCRASALSALRKAFMAELPRAERMKARDAWGKETPLMSGLIAMAEASARLEGPGSVEWLLKLFGSGRSFRNFAANVTLTAILSELPGDSWNAPDEWTDARAPEWRAWWVSKTRGSQGPFRFQGLFRLDLCPVSR